MNDEENHMFTYMVAFKAGQAEYGGFGPQCRYSKGGQK